MSKKTVKVEKKAKETAADVVMQYEGLMQHPGWMKLVVIMEKNMQLLKEQIIAKKALDGSPLTEAAVDLLRYRLDDIQEIRTSPERYVKMLVERGEEALEEDYDPFAKAGDSSG
jgi:hypothetical protein